MSRWIKLFVAVVAIAAAAHLAIILFAPFVILRGDVTTQAVRIS